MCIDKWDNENPPSKVLAAASIYILTKLHVDTFRGSELLIAFNTDPIPVGLPRVVRDEFREFASWPKGHSIKLFVRGYNQLFEAWSLFQIQPVPTPPLFWRWTCSTERNQTVLNKLPSLE